MRDSGRQLPGLGARWTLLIVTPKRLQMVYDYDTPAEADAALAKAHERGERAFIQPRLSAWGRAYEVSPGEDAQND